MTEYVWPKLPLKFRPCPGRIELVSESSSTAGNKPIF